MLHLSLWKTAVAPFVNRKAYQIPVKTMNKSSVRVSIFSRVINTVQDKAHSRTTLNIVLRFQEFNFRNFIVQGFYFKISPTTVSFAYIYTCCIYYSLVHIIIFISMFCVTIYFCGITQQTSYITERRQSRIDVCYKWMRSYPSIAMSWVLSRIHILTTELWH